jgi:hypothetical protein
VGIYDGFKQRIAVFEETKSKPAKEFKKGKKAESSTSSLSNESDSNDSRESAPVNLMPSHKKHV